MIYKEVAETLIDLPNLVRAESRIQKLSYRDLARETGLSYSVVFRYLSGRGGITTNSAIKLLKWLDEVA